MKKQILLIMSISLATLFWSSCKEETVNPLIDNKEDVNNLNESLVRKMLSKDPLTGKIAKDTFIYDANERLVELIEDIEGDQVTYSYKWQDNRLIQLSKTNDKDESLGIFTYQYNERGQILRIISSFTFFERVDEYFYDSDGKLDYYILSDEKHEVTERNDTVYEDIFRYSNDEWILAEEYITWQDDQSSYFKQTKLAGAFTNSDGTPTEESVLEATSKSSTIPVFEAYSMKFTHKFLSNNELKYWAEESVVNNVFCKHEFIRDNEGRLINIKSCGEDDGLGDQIFFY